MIVSRDCVALERPLRSLEGRLSVCLSDYGHGMHIRGDWISRSESVRIRNLVIRSSERGVDCVRADARGCGVRAAWRCPGATPLIVAGLPCTRTVTAKFHYAILVAEGPKQVRSWSQTCSELKFGLYHLARQQRTSTSYSRSATGSATSFGPVCDQIA